MTKFPVRISFACVSAAIAFFLAVNTASAGEAPVEPSKEAYVQAVVRGAGLMPWQSGEVSVAEKAFRAEIEARKDALLASRDALSHPRMVSEADIRRARDNIAGSDWAKVWFDARKARADYLVAQPPEYVDAMISVLTPANPYGTTCPKCVGKKSQEGAGMGLMMWNYPRSPTSPVPPNAGRSIRTAEFEEKPRNYRPRAWGRKFS